MKRTGHTLGIAALICGAAIGNARAATPKSPEELYSMTNVWSLQLKFTEQQWNDMEPRGQGGFFGGGGGPRPGPGGGGFGGPPRMGPGPGGPGPGGPFGPGMFVAPVFMRDGDGDQNGSLSKDEFAALGKKWFEKWDAKKKGSIDLDELRSGITAMMPAPGGPGGGPGGRGPGGPMRMGLQGAEGQRNGIAAGMEFEYVHADLQFEGTTVTNVGARYKGNGTYLQSQRSEKRPMKVDLNKNVKGQKIAGVSTLNLHNAVTDPSWMNEVLAFRLYRDAKVPAPRTAFARVKIDAPPEHKNEYFGLYNLVENVDAHFAKETFGVKDGAVFKPVTPNLFGDLGDDWRNYNQTYDPKDATKEDKQRVIQTCKFVAHADEKEFAEKIGDYIELDEFARYMAVTVWLTDQDGILGPGQNFYLFLHPKTRKFTFIAWDQDHSFGQMGGRGSQEDRETLSINKPWSGQNPFLERMFKVEAFKKKYLGYLDEFSKTIFKPERLAKQVDELAPIIRGAVKDESADKLSRFDAAVSGKMVEGMGFGPFGGSTKPIKGFAPERNKSIIAQLAGKEEGAQVDGFGGRRGPGGGGGIQMPPAGMILGEPFMNALDADKNGSLTHDETVKSFAKLFADWDSDKNNALSMDELQAGIGKDMMPRFPGFGGGPGGPGGPGPGGFRPGGPGGPGGPPPGR